MNKVLELLLDGEALDTKQISEIIGISEDEVNAEMKLLIDEKILLGWRPVFSPDALDKEQIKALIEVKITPEREGGFDRIAERISRFDEVETCYLMSGAYDLMVIVKGDGLHSIAKFVSARLASIDGVLSTATHFILRAYKDSGFMLDSEYKDPDKLAVSP